MKAIASRAHLLDGVWHRAAGRADTAVVERDDAVVGGDAVDDPRVPVVEDRGQVVQEHHRNAVSRCRVRGRRT